MHDVLLVYKQVEMCFDQEGRLIIPMDEPKTVTISYDEKPGIQAIENIAPDLLPVKGHGKVARDYEYKRLGTLSLLAGMDLLTGEIIPLVSDTHKSSDFIEWLTKLDIKYPKQDTIRLVLDNHFVRKSLKTSVFYPQHGSGKSLITFCTSY